MKKAFVLGKFYPFHFGHKTLIDFALQKCDFLYVLVCASDKEKIRGEIRAEWILKTFENEHNIEIIVVNYVESELPNTSVSSREISYMWAKKFEEILPKDINMIVSSEEYGRFVAEYMQIHCVFCDRKREKVPISATQIRKDILKNWKFLPQKVQAFFAKKVIILGTESTGKSTLTTKIADYFGVPYVQEMGREIIANSQNFTFSDLFKVVKAHSAAIQDASNSFPPLLIIDTDLHLTASYARFCFQQEIPLTKEDIQTQKADLYLYLGKDAPFIQDGTRLTETDRNLLDASHLQILKEKGIFFEEISGNWEERTQKAITLIQELLQF